MLHAARLKLLADERLIPLILKMSMPSIIGISVSAIYQLLNAFFVGRLGTYPMAAMAMAFPFALVLTAIGQCFGAGAASVCARSLGRSDHESANTFASQALLGAMMTAIVTAGAIHFFNQPLLSLIGTSSETMPFALDYSKWLLLGYIGVISNTVCGFIVRAEGNTSFSMWTLLVAFIVNAVFDPILIFGFNMGIGGAGLATVVGQICAISMYVWHFMYKRGVVKITLRHLNFKWSFLSEVIHIGSPAAINIILSVIAMSVLNKLAAGYGEAAVAGVGIASRLLLAATLPLTGLCNGAQSVVGFNLGAKNWVRVMDATKIILTIGFGFALTYLLIVISFPKEIVGAFSSDHTVIEIGARAVVLFHFSLPMFAIQQVVMLLLMAEGEAKLAMFLTIMRQGTLIVLLYFLQHLYGEMGLVSSILAADLIVGAISLVILLKRLRFLERRMLTEPAFYKERCAG